jgi:hypothetical protein
MKATINAPADERTTIGQIIGKTMHVKASGKELPQEFIIYATNQDGTNFGVRPVYSYTEALAVVRKINFENSK